MTRRGPCNVVSLTDGQPCEEWRSCPDADPVDHMFPRRDWHPSTHLHRCPRLSSYKTGSHVCTLPHSFNISLFSGLTSPPTESKKKQAYLESLRSTAPNKGSSARSQLPGNIAWAYEFSQVFHKLLTLIVQKTIRQTRNSHRHGRPEAMQPRRHGYVSPRTWLSRRLFGNSSFPRRGLEQANRLLLRKGYPNHRER